MTAPRPVELRELNGSRPQPAAVPRTGGLYSLPPAAPRTPGCHPMRGTRTPRAQTPPRAPAPTPSAAAAQPDVGVIAAQLHRALAAEPASRMPALELREQAFRETLAETDVDVDELRRIVWAHGVPDSPWARPLAWKLLCGYLPSNRTEWDASLAANRADYWARVADLTVDPSESPAADDHPLRVETGSRWAEFFRDRELHAVIDRDVVRTHGDLHRFMSLRNALSRVLFVYCKSTAATDGYRQGMNELAAPLLLCFSDAPRADPSDAEADAFFCFKRIMVDVASLYVVKETETTGIGRQLQELQALLRIKDPRLDAHLSQLEIDTRYYALRWMRLWLTREFSMPDAFRIWDSLLASEVRLQWLRYVCVAMLVRIRDQLLAADFPTCMKLLLQYPVMDISELLQVADRLRTANVTITRAAKRRTAK